MFNSNQKEKKIADKTRDDSSSNILKITIEGPCGQQVVVALAKTVNEMPVYSVNIILQMVGIWCYFADLFKLIE